MSMAVISPCGLYRYRIERDVQLDGVVAGLFGINPSYADAIENDPTMRKDIGFAKMNGWRRIIKGNVFAYRSKDVRKLGQVKDPVGPENTAHIYQIIADADVLVPMWGATTKVPKALRGEYEAMMLRLLESGKPIMHFGVTKDGDPRHPLFLRYTTPLIEWGVS